MIQRQLKLKLTKAKESMLISWLNNLTGVWNYSIRKILLDAQDGIYYTPKSFQNLLSGHGKKLEIPSHVIQGVLSSAHLAWKRCFKKITKKPHLKGMRNKLNSIPFPDPIRPPKNNRIGIPGLGSVRYCAQELPEGKIKCGRIVKRASGWYLCLFIDAEPNAIPITGNGEVGIDPGFKHLLTLSTGEKIEHPKELQHGALRLAQAQRGHDKQLASRLQERMANQRKDRNHKLSRRLVSENFLICFSKDNIRGIARKFGKSVSSAATGQLRQFISYKSSQCGRRFVQVDPKFSTMTCSSCGAQSGPTGLRRLAVRHWNCACGAQHDRDINAACNVLIAGAGIALERSSAYV
jgi:putative transposase